MREPSKEASIPFKNKAQVKAIFAKDKALGKEFAAHTPNMAALPAGPAAPGAGPKPMGGGLANLMQKKNGLMGR